MHMHMYVVFLLAKAMIFQEEQAVLDRIVRERRSSLAPVSLAPASRRPHILVSEASVQVLDDDYDDLTSVRRASTQSLGPVVVPEPGRRSSTGRLIDVPGQPRRSSFQGICETAVTVTCDNFLHFSRS